MSEGERTYGDGEVEALLTGDLARWELRDGAIRRRYRTAGWKGTLMVITTVGHLAEVAWHHPDISASYAWVEVSLTTHSAGGITDKDLALARADRGGGGLAAGRRGRALHRDARRSPLRLRAPRRGLGAPGQEGPQQVVPVLGQHRLGVELEPHDRVLAVSQRHDLVLLAARRDHQLVGEVGRLDDQRVVAARRSGGPGGPRRRPRRRGRCATPCRASAAARARSAPRTPARCTGGPGTRRGSGRRGPGGAPAARTRPPRWACTGPGEMTMCDGSRAAISSTDRVSQRTISVGKPSSRT